MAQKITGDGSVPFTSPDKTDNHSTSKPVNNDGKPKTFNPDRYISAPDSKPIETHHTPIQERTVAQAENNQPAPKEPEASFQQDNKRLFTAVNKVNRMLRSEALDRLAGIRDKHSLLPFWIQDKKRYLIRQFRAFDLLELGKKNPEEHEKIMTLMKGLDKRFTEHLDNLLNKKADNNLVASEVFHALTVSQNFFGDSNKALATLANSKAQNPDLVIYSYQDDKAEIHYSDTKVLEGFPEKKTPKST